MLVTKENTSKLMQMNTFCTEKMRLEAQLDALQNNLVSANYHSITIS